jgi:acyl transferase domain-containing protein
VPSFARPQAAYVIGAKTFTEQYVLAALLQQRLAADGVDTRPLKTSHAFHSSMMEPILSEFEGLVAGVKLSAPAIPLVATLTGEWANGPVTQPAYWSAQLRSTVRFADGMRALTGARSPVAKDALYLEVGPGNTLATFASENVRSNGTGAVCLTSLPGANDRRTDTELMLGSLGQLWANGAAVDWDGFHKSERRSRVSLPTYPFERRSYWVGTRPGQPVAAVQREARDTTNWFYRPVWKQLRRSLMRCAGVASSCSTNRPDSVPL